MQRGEINSTICEDELERSEEETSGPISRYCPNICLQALRKTTKLIRMLGPQVRKQSWALPNYKTDQDTWSSGQEKKLGPPKHKAEVLVTCLLYLV